MYARMSDKLAFQTTRRKKRSIDFARYFSKISFFQMSEAKPSVLTIRFSLHKNGMQEIIIELLAFLFVKTPSKWIILQETERLKLLHKRKKNITQLLSPLKIYSERRDTNLNWKHFIASVIWWYSMIWWTNNYKEIYIKTKMQKYTITQ